MQILNSLFYLVCYSVIGTIFLTQFYKEAFFLIINGNGGFVGDYFYNKIFFKIVNLNTELSYYFQIILFIALFLISINFKLIWLTSLKKIFESKKKTSLHGSTDSEKDVIIKTDNIQETFSFEEKK